MGVPYVGGAIVIRNNTMSLTVLANYVSFIVTLFGLFGVNIAAEDLQATIRVISALIAVSAQIVVHWGRIRRGDLTLGGFRKPRPLP